MNRKTVFFANVGLSIFFLGACSHVPLEHLEHTKQRNLSSVTLPPHLKWQHTPVQVCWAGDYPERFDCQEVRYRAKPEFHFVTDAPTRQLIQELIEWEFTKEKTGLTFTGWKPCQKDKPTDLVLVLRTEPNPIDVLEITGHSSFGPCSNLTLNEPSKGQPNILIDILTGEPGHAISLQNYLRLVSLHEFTHAAGLLHEGDRARVSDEQKTSISDSISMTSEGYLNGLLMSVTSNTQFQNRIHLSPGDRHALRCLYGYSHYSDQERKKSCALDAPIPVENNF